jgi:putative N6-adenine-specific DNA methylase
VSTQLDCYVVVPPGLEAFAQRELSEMGVRKSRTVHGGVEAELTARQLYVLHRFGRVFTRVLVRVGGGRTTDFDDLMGAMRSIDWERWLPNGHDMHVSVSARKSRLHHTGAIAERVCRALDRVESPDGPGVYVRLDHDRLTVSVDATGRPMHERGWRTESHAAPLRATFAAAMVMATGWDGTVPLVDPMAGSGTIVVEAASMASGLDHQRDFAFQQWPSFEPGTWAAASASTRDDNLRAAVVAADRDAGAVAMTELHLANAGLGPSATVEHGAISNVAWPNDGWVITNPPYGNRIGGGDPRDLMATLGRRTREHSMKLCILLADDSLIRATGVRLERVMSFSNGGTPVSCWMSM